jgi:tetratricopeptide (TPR) repeat protein
MIKKSFTIFIVGFTILNLLCISILSEEKNDFELGIRSYMRANSKHNDSDFEGEILRLIESYEIFNNSAPFGDDDALVMSYAIFLRLQNEKTRSLPEELRKKIPGKFINFTDIKKIVKREFDNFPTVNNINAFKVNPNENQLPIQDKERLLESLNKIASQEIKKATKIFNEARRLIKKGEYRSALTLLNEANEIWELEGIPASRNEIDELIKEGQSANTLYVKSQRFYKMGDFRKALYLINESLEKKVTAEAKKLKRNINKRLSNIAIFINIGGFGKFDKTYNYEYSGNSRSNVAEVTDINILDMQSVGKNAPLNWGIIIPFSKFSPFGIMFSSTSVKYDWLFATDYTARWKWLNGQGVSATGSALENANASATFYNVNFSVSKPVNDFLVLNAYVGPTIFSSKMDLSAGLGFAGTWDWEGRPYREWFPFIYRIDESKTGFGANFGGGFELKFPPVGIFIDFQYYLVMSPKSTWRLVPQLYDGGIGNFYVDQPQNLSNLPKYDIKLNFSTYKINMGVKFYF